MLQNSNQSGSPVKVRLLGSAVLVLFAAQIMHAAEDRSAAAVSYGELPLSFESNQGQAPSDAVYLSRTQGGVVLLRPGSVALASDTGKPVTMRFVGPGSMSSRPVGEDKMPGVTSYLVGEQRDWIRRVPNYARVRYASVYPGIDAVFHGDQRRLEYDFVLSPGADPGRIRLAFDGVDRLRVDAEGNLQLITARGVMTQRKPRIWQSGPRGRREVEGRYVLSGRRQARFDVEVYDRGETLVIDPVIEYSTYFGSTRDDRVQAVATDSTGAVYLAGTTSTGGVSWGFVSKVNPAGTSVVYTVFFGSNVCDASARGVAVDSGNNALVTGFYTQYDASGACTLKRVLGAKINPAGDAFVYELLWGGADDYGNAVVVDGAGNAYFTGSTNGGFPTTAGVISPSGTSSRDAFITKMNPAGTPVYSTYLGGGLADEGLAIAIDLNGNAYVAGSTASPNFPKTANAVQATAPNPNAAGFVTEVNSTATQILYSTFLGGNNGESARAIAVDSQGKIYVAGETSSSNFPTTTSAWDRTCGTDAACNPYNDGAWHNGEDVFFSKLDPLKAGTAGLLYSTFLGGSGRDFAETVAIDKNGRAWLSGRTASTTDFPTVQPTQATNGGDYDAFVAEIDPVQVGAASLLFSTFLGGSLYEEGTGAAVDSLGNIYVGGYTASTNLPVAAALQPQNAGGNEGFLVKIAAPAPGVLGAVSIAPTATPAGASATGTVTLSSAAGAGGATVSLNTNSTATFVPGTVVVPAGQTKATFAISTFSVTAATAATITATYGGVAKTATLTVNPAVALNAVAVSPASVVGGAATAGTVTLSAAAPAGGLVVTLASSNANAATVPATVTVAAGATTATFAVGTKTVPAGTIVNITATYSGVTKTAALVVNPLLGSVTLNPSVVAGGKGSTGTVTLNGTAPAGGAVVTLTSSNTTVAAVPASVTVAAGATTATFAVTTTPVIAVTSANITATNNGGSRVVTLVVNPPLTGLTAVPASVVGGSGSTGTVTLSSVAPAGGAAVALASSSAIVGVPASVTVAAGATSANFAISTQAVTTATAATITATYSGSSKTITVAVNPPISALTVNPASVLGGAGSTGAVTLGAVAPAGGAVVALVSNNAAATVPASVTVTAGTTTATFAITTKAVTAATAATITATYNGLAKTVTLTVNPSAALNTVTVNPTAVIGGAGSTGTVTLVSAAPAGGAVVALASNNAAATVPASVTVTAGTTTATFAITTKAVTAVTAATITATCSGLAKTATLTVNPSAALNTVTVNPTAVIGGAGSTGTVTLVSAAPAGGAVVALASNNAATTVPASVTVAAGAMTATFAITTKAVTAVTATTITATYNGVAKTATLTVNPPSALNAVAVNPTAVIGGAGSTGRVTLTSAAPAGGAVVSLVSNNLAATVPTSVTVAAGATTATFAITTKAVTAATVAAITATYNGVAKTAGLTVNPNAALNTVAVNPTAVLGGAGSTGTVTLTSAALAGGAVVGLTSNNAAATVPASVTVAAGATTSTFAITTKAVTAVTVTTITATYNGLGKTAALTVNPATALNTLAINPTAVIGGAGSTGTVTLTSAAPAGGATVALVSNNLAATVPTSVTVAAGATTATFAITTKAVTAETVTTITATYNGIAKAAALTVEPPVALNALTLNPTAVIGGSGSTGTVTLTAAAPAGGKVVALASNNAAGTVPATVTVAAGATTANFAITTQPVTTATAVAVTATYNGVAKAATLTVNPPAALAGIVVTPAVIIAGSTATGTVTLTSAAPAGGAVVALSSSDWVSFYLPASVTVPAGATSAKFTITTRDWRSTTTITASYNGVDKTAVLTSVYPNVVALTCTPNPVIAEQTTTCTVTLNGIMPSATTVWILSDQPFFAPASGTVTVPAGARSTKFSITTTLVPDIIVAHISANALATDTVTTALTINLTNRGRKWVLNNVAFKGGGTATGYFIYDAATAKYLAANILVTPGPDPNNPLGHPPLNLYYYPWPNGFNPTFVDDWSTASLMSLQNPLATTDPRQNYAWSLLQLNFAQALTNAGGIVALVTNPNVAYDAFCQNTTLFCTPPPNNISQESFKLAYDTMISGYFRVVVSGTVTAQ